MPRPRRLLHSADIVTEHVRVAVVGAGFAGIGAAISLLRDGERDFVVLERNEEVGGTWWDNTYPGCRCDVPSHLYSFSFAPNPGWTETYAPQPEIHRYIQRVTDESGIRPHIRLRTEVTGATWDEEAGAWAITTSTGDLTAQFLIVGPGALNEPKIPPLPGLEDFEGTTFHTAAWRHDHDLAGERVAVIGTGASAVQVVPEVQARAGRLHLFQRTPPWILPLPNRRITDAERTLYTRLPIAQRLVRGAVYWAREALVPGLVMEPRLLKLPQVFARRHLNKQVADPELRGRLTPDYRFGCKRILMSNAYYPALTQANAEVITDPISRVGPHSITTGDGVEREIDTIIFGTGFRVAPDIPVAAEIFGPRGSMNEVWKGTPQAYLGTTVSGFPNLFMMIGPHTGNSHSSMIFVIEAQLAHVIGALRHMKRTGSGSFEVREDVQTEFNALIARRLKGTVWTDGGCTSWYVDATGQVIRWPGSTWDFWRRTRTFDPAAYRIERRAARVPVPLPG